MTIEGDFHGAPFTIIGERKEFKTSRYEEEVNVTLWDLTVAEGLIFIRDSEGTILQVLPLSNKELQKEYLPDQHGLDGFGAITYSYRMQETEYNS